MRRGRTVPTGAAADRHRLRHGSSNRSRPRSRGELELPRGRGGAIVTDVERNSPANAGVSRRRHPRGQPQKVANVSQVTRELQNAAARPGRSSCWSGATDSSSS